MPAVSGDDALLVRIRSLCAPFPEAEEHQLQGRPLWVVRRRRFAIFNGTDSPPRPRWKDWGSSLHFLAESLELRALQSDSRFGESPHHGSSGWMAISLVEPDVDWDEIGELLEAGYRRAASRELRAVLDQRQRPGSGASSPTS